jgi:hypothetical protein
VVDVKVKGKLTKRQSLSDVRESSHEEPNVKTYYH